MTQPDDLVDARIIAGMLAVDESTVWRWAKANVLPQPVVRRKKFTRWRRGEVVAAREKLLRDERRESAS